MFIKIGNKSDIPPVGAGSDKIFYTNGKLVLSSYTLTDNMNAMSAGPITIESSATVTIPDNSVWTVV